MQPTHLEMESDYRLHNAFQQRSKLSKETWFINNRGINAKKFVKCYPLGMYLMKRMKTNMFKVIVYFVGANEFVLFCVKKVNADVNSCRIWYFLTDSLT